MPSGPINLSIPCVGKALYALKAGCGTSKEPSEHRESSFFPALRAAEVAGDIWLIAFRLWELCRAVTRAQEASNTFGRPQNSDLDRRDLFEWLN